MVIEIYKLIESTFTINLFRLTFILFRYSLIVTEIYKLIESSFTINFFRLTINLKP